MLEEFDRSAMTGRKFAAWAGIKYTTFSNWRRAWRKAAGSSQRKDSVESAGGTRWLEAVMGPSRLGTASSPNAAVLVVQGPGGLRLELSSVEQVPLAARLLRELDGRRDAEFCRQSTDLRRGRAVRHAQELPGALGSGDDGAQTRPAQRGTLRFSNHRRNRLKILYWDRTGLWVLCKRLERGTYSWPKGEEKAIELRPEALAMLTDGIELHGAKMRPWYDRGE
ncbi:MAG: IS66 family insertion sequence element accessory protein TnpB [Verrucomicrobiota bacterium]